MKLFCKHLWKLENKEYLYTQIHYKPGHGFPDIYMGEEDISAVTYRCLCCGKIKIVEEKGHTKYNPEREW